MTAAGSRRRRLLIVLDHPGALLHFDETLRELVRRGVEPHLAFLRPEKYGDALDVLGDAAERMTVHLHPPVRSGGTARVAAFIRGSADYVHYLAPPMAGARYSRPKWLDLSPFPPFVKRRLAGRTSAPAWLVRRLLGVLARAEAALAAPREVTRFVEGVAPDAIVVSPLIDRGAHQTDYVKAGFELGLPTALLVTSWDNLTSKGRIRVLPDRVVVWNETQAHEAAEYHDVPRERIVLTGAQQFDRWFERRPSTTRPEFLARFDLPGDRPFILFTCSTRQKTAREAEPLYVRRWLEALRVAEDPELRNAAVLIRPHPTAASRWEGVELEDLGPVRIWRRERPLPVAVDDRADYFDALYHCSALVAINSTSMIEAAIVDRPVHTIAVPEFAVMQHDLMHFHYLLRANGGFLREASTFEEHTRLLSDDLRDPGRDADARRRFVDSFIRPPAGKPSATAALADAMLEIPDVAPSAARTTLGGRLVVAALSIAFRLAGRARIRPLLARGI